VRAEPKAVLSLANLAVAEYVWRPDLPIAVAPRPYLHPVRTLSGTVVTEVRPSSHRHHLGVSVAVAEIDGSNFWGGRTFVAGHGPAWLDNHGIQRHVRWTRRTPTQLSHSLRWVSIDEEELLSERRMLSARLVEADAWALTWEFALTNTAGRALTIRSPAGMGRAGAGFGGFFWRAPIGVRSCHVASAAGDRIDAVHGARSPWLALTNQSEEQRQWTLVFIAATEATRDDPWFVRIRDYVGVGSALAWDDPLVLAPGATATRRVITVVADGTLSSTRAAALAAELAS
jgi:hypothetical protein